jgi:hemerythrin-like domain-containing protein
MDAIQLLKDDHQKVRDLFEQLEQITDDAEQQSLFEQIRDELTTHAFVEETVFYPALNPYETFTDLLEDSFEDHQEMKDLIAEIEESGVASDEFLDQIEDLRDLVEEHVEVEETELLPKARDVLSADEFERLGRHMLDAREGAKKRPQRAA